MKPFGWVLRGSVGAIGLLLVAPTIVVIVASFSAGEDLQFPPRGLSIAAYQSVLGDAQMWHALGNSLWISAVAVVIDVLLGVPAALALDGREPRAGSTLIRGVLSVPIAIPIIVSATAFLLVFTALGSSQNLTLVGFAIAVVNLPLVLFTTGAALLRVDPELEEAASTLGAEEIQQMLLVKLPQLASGIVTGALLVFVLTLTDFVVSLMLTTSVDVTLPVYVYSGLQVTVSPTLGAISALFIAVVGITFVVILRVGRIDRYLKRPFP